MARTWIEQAIDEMLTMTDPQELLRDAVKHINVEGTWTKGKVRPSLIGDPCPLSQMKKFAGHGPQPGEHWMAARAGRPNGGTALNFLRGWILEGIVVSALMKTGKCEIVGKSPDMVFAWKDLEGHPDVLIRRDDELELIQIKNPAAASFQHYARGRYDPMERYLPQIGMEIYLARKMGWQVVRSNLLLVTLEPWPPSVSLYDSGIQSMCVSVDWSSDLEAIVEEGINRVRENAQAVKQGEWPGPLPIDQAVKYPCSYCSFSRTASKGIVACDDIKAWEGK